MAEEKGEELPEDLPPELGEWVVSRAEETERSAADVLARAVVVYRSLDEATASDAGAGDLPRRIADLDDRIAAIEDGFDRKITDVRERVIQVKREADAKAPAEHTHEELHATAEEAARTARKTHQAIESTHEQLGTLEARVEQGFNNYETVVTHLDETVDQLVGKADQLAKVAADLRKRTAQLEARATKRDAVGSLKREANREGIRTAKCGSCGAGIDIGLLTEPQCPHCEAVYTDVTPGSGLFGSAELVVGDRPAIEGDTEPSEATPADIFEEHATDD